LIIYDGKIGSKFNADIKMVDFANCVTKIQQGVSCPPTTDGVDGGYLMGLQTMVTNLEELFEEISRPELRDEFGHVDISKLTLSQRAAAEIGK
jgi:hypothetical protein